MQNLSHNMIYQGDFSKQIHVIDLDPYGSAIPFLEAAI